MLIRHVIASLDPAQGGPPRVAVQLAAAQRLLGCRVGVISQEHPQRLSQTLDFAEQLRPGASQMIQLEPVGCSMQRRLGLVLAEATRQALQDCPAGETVLHIHGLWDVSSLLAARHARRLQIPYVVRPAGMLEPWCMEQKPVRKRLAWLAGYRQMLCHAAAIHTTSQQEAENVQRLGIATPIAVIPHGVDIPATPLADLHAAREKQPQRTLLFLSRVQRKKGLLNLIEAWSAVQEDFPQWRLVIAGPDEDGHTAEVQAAAQQRSARNITFAGPVFGEAKQRLLASSHLLVLPTQSENFGVVVAEALANGLPVITTTAAPWQDLHTHRCGWWTGVTAATLTSTLRQALRTTDETRRQMGQRGQQLVQEKYTWPQMAARTVALYKQISGVGDRPDFLVEPPDVRRRLAG